MGEQLELFVMPSPDVRRERVWNYQGRCGWQWGYNVYSGSELIFTSLERQEAYDYAIGVRYRHDGIHKATSLPRPSEESRDQKLLWPFGDEALPI